MNPVECEFEAEVLAAVTQSRWPARVDEALRHHVAGCQLCSDVVTVASAFDGAYEELTATAALPDASRVWRTAQLRARHEAVETAGRPITAAQVIAFACAVALLGACFGATSSSFQSALGWSAANSDAVAAWFASISKLLAEHGTFVLGLLAAVFLVPTVFYVAMGRE
jgi:hypothetical protein